jgi:hypothetical protein
MLPQDRLDALRACAAANRITEFEVVARDALRVLLAHADALAAVNADLLAVCDEAADLIDEDGNIDSETVQDVQALARAALAKAHGEEP